MGESVWFQWLNTTRTSPGLLGLASRQRFSGILSLAIISPLDALSIRVVENCKRSKKQSMWIFFAWVELLRILGKESILYQQNQTLALFFRPRFHILNMTKFNWFKYHAKWNTPFTKDKYCRILLIPGTYNGQIHRDKKENGACWGQGK